MSDTFSLSVDGFADGAPIPGQFAFCVPADEGHVAMGDNRNPAVHLSGAPIGTKTFALICHDPDVPSSGEDVNQEGKTVPANLPRVDFFHWVVVDIPADCNRIEKAADSNGITARGKTPGHRSYGVVGINSYTDWFAKDADMGGTYGGYDGPCPPWNDSIKHHYIFTLYALNADSLDLSGAFTGAKALAAMEDHVLSSASYVGTYSLNPDVPA